MELFSKQSSCSCYLLMSCCLLGLLFDTEDGDSKCFWNVDRRVGDCTVARSRREYLCHDEVVADTGESHYLCWGVFFMYYGLLAAWFPDSNPDTMCLLACRADLSLFRLSLSIDSPDSPFSCLLLVSLHIRMSVYVCPAVCPLSVHYFLICLFSCLLIRMPGCLSCSVI
jgi:hypothetical protein